MSAAREAQGVTALPLSEAAIQHALQQPLQHILLAAVHLNHTLLDRSTVGGICFLSGSGSALKACESCGWVWSCCLVQPKQAGKGFVHSLTAWAHSHVLAKCHLPNVTQLTRLFSAHTTASPGLLWIKFLSAQQRHHLPFVQGRLSRLPLWQVKV